MDNFIKKLTTFLTQEQTHLGEQKEIRVWGYHEPWCEKAKGNPNCSCDPAIFIYNEAVGGFHVIPGGPPEGEVNAAIREKALEIQAEREKMPSQKKPTGERVATRRPPAKRGDIFIDNIEGKTVVHRGRPEDLEKLREMFPGADLARGYWIILREGS